MAGVKIERNCKIEFRRAVFADKVSRVCFSDADSYFGVAGRVERFVGVVSCKKVRSVIFVRI